MAEEAMDVIDAGKTIASLLTGQPEEADAMKAPTEPEATEEVAQETTEGVPTQDTEEVDVAEATDEAQEDINENSEEPSYEVKVNGQTLNVTLDELLQGYQREADYTRGKQDLSLEKSRLDQTLQQSQTEINQKLAKLNDLNNSAQSLSLIHI